MLMKKYERMRKMNHLMTKNGKIMKMKQLRRKNRGMIKLKHATRNSSRLKASIYVTSFILIILFSL